ncbi:hypothetical protein B0T20DRAFT_153670 [Sordaria brevicollis]|uniref:Uncharacterized protein n=1 Tax=Sordaria brevicollis TaxID=83679 RepID=A0AAE0UEG8_SORBR|nr:hypothetical protein B0T20DRAFT_153670 [Sordaria brevicollis]
MNTPTLNPSHPTRQHHLYTASNPLTPTVPASATTGPAPGEQQVKPSTSVNTLVPLDIEENSPDGRPRHRNRKPREFGLKAIRNHKFAVITRCFLIAFSIAVLAYVRYVHTHWVEERKEARDDENYEGGYVATTMAIVVNLIVLLLIVVGYYGGSTGGAALGLFGDLSVMGICVYGFTDMAPWTWEGGQPNSFGNKFDGKPYRDDKQRQK